MSTVFADAVRADRITLRRWRAALVTAFFGTGLCTATWVSRTPAIRQALHASTAEMGLVIAGLSIGSVVGIAAGGVLSNRRGARFVVVAGLLSVALGLAVIPLGVALGQAPLVSVGLACFGYGMGSSEIGLNVEGVELEARMGRSIVPGLHGSYSVGTFVGGLVGLGANAAHVPVPIHLLAVAAITAAATVWLGRQLPVLRGADAHDAPGGADGTIGTAAPPARWWDSRLIALAAIILGMALAEGSANDWLPLITVDGFGKSAAAGSIIYAGFGLAMAIGRLAGGRVIDRFGSVRVMRVCSLLAAFGIGLVSLAPSFWIAVGGVLFWGLGTSLGFPVAMSASGGHPAHAGRRASVVAAAGYSAFLIGPPMLGFVGQQVGLREAILIVMGAVLATVVVAGAVRKPSPGPAISLPDPVRD